MNLRNTFLLLALVSGQAHAARIVSSVWPPTDAQPDQCAYIEGTAVPMISPVESVTGGVRCNIDVSGIPSGAHTYQVFAKSAVWGDSLQVPFTFTAGVPRVPGGLRIIP